MKKVSIVVLTYNLEKYINQCLESILAQKVNFDYEIIIADDFSKDKTREILKKYYDKYPDKIRLILAEQNGGTLTNNNRALEYAKGQYFTLIDGDDYWIDENRLQCQVDFLDSHEDFAMCTGNTIYMRNGKLAEKVISSKYLDKEYSFKDLCNFQMPYVHTSSMLTRNLIYSHGVPQEYYRVIGTFEECAVRGDYIRIIQHLQLGKLMVMKQDYSVYRVHENGIWQGQNNIMTMLESVISFDYFNRYFDDAGTGFFEHCLVDAYRSLMDALTKEDRFINQYNLTAKESRLLVSLFEQLVKEQINWDYYTKPKKQNVILMKVKQSIKEMLHL